MIYLDNQATTAIDPRVVAKMVPYMTTHFANVHSTHRLGRSLRGAVEKAREQVAGAIGATPGEIIFTSGATESNNIALKGVCHFYGDEKPHLAISRIEHKCVLESARKLESEGFKLHWIDVDDEGRAKIDQLQDLLKTYYDPEEEESKVAIVSIMAVNNEIGTIQDLGAIGKICERYDTLFHTDAAQALGKVPLDVVKDKIDLMSLSGHKIYGPKGVGALYIKRTDEKRVHLDPVFSGGGQEGGVRSGTLPVFLVVGMGEAAELAQREMKKDALHYKSLFEIAKEKLLSLPSVRLNGPFPEDVVSTDKAKSGRASQGKEPFSRRRILNNMNISFFGVEGESLMLGLDDAICMSSGSACTSQSLEPSHVLFALGLDPEFAHTAVRLGTSRFTTEAEFRRACDLIAKRVAHLRDLSPLWEMAQKGIDTKSIEWKHD